MPNKKNEMSNVDTEPQAKKLFGPTLYEIVFCGFIKNDKLNDILTSMILTLKLIGYYWFWFQLQILIFSSSSL